jgi:hypothetical protein
VSKPADIPQDAWREAEAAWLAIHERPYLSRDEEVSILSRAIMAATERERERCALKADAARMHYAEKQSNAKLRKDRVQERDFESMRIAAAGIASDIRQGALPSNAIPVAGIVR